MALANIEYVDPETGEPVDPGYGQGHPKPPHLEPPIVVPMPPNIGGGPIIVPPGSVENPIVIPDPPDKPSTKPPGTLWPPVGPGDGIPEGKNWLLVLVVGAKGRKRAKLILTDVHIDQGLPPSAGPK